MNGDKDQCVRSAIFDHVDLYRRQGRLRPMLRSSEMRCEDLNGGANFKRRILVDDRIDGPIAQKLATFLGQLMRDEDDAALAVCFRTSTISWAPADAL